MLYHVVAMAENRVIGQGNKLPWHFKADLQHFKRLTLGSTVLMGRKTFESIGKPLAERQNFVLSRGEKSSGGSVRFFGDLEEALESVETEHCYVIGGEDLYRQTIHRVDGIYLTRIEAQFPGDRFYPAIPRTFKEISRTRLQESPVLDVIFYENHMSPKES